MLHEVMKKSDKTKARGATGGTDYLLGFNSRMTQPEVLRGNPDITKALLANESGAGAYTCGVLSFTENALDVSQEAQDFAMNVFEETLMAGFPPEHYDILWVKHDDKDFDESRGSGRLELNYHIVNRDLVTGKKLTPYLHKYDLPRVNLAKQIINDKYGFESPDDPKNAQELNYKGYGSENKGAAKKLNDEVIKGLEDGSLNSRDDIINHLKNHPDIEVMKDKQPDNYLVVKMKGATRNLRLKGTIYGSKFTSPEQLIKDTSDQHRDYVANRGERLQANIDKLREANGKTGAKRAKLLKPKQKRGRKPKGYKPDSDKGLQQQSKDGLGASERKGDHRNESYDQKKSGAKPRAKGHSRDSNQRKKASGRYANSPADLRVRKPNNGHRPRVLHGGLTPQFSSLDFSKSLEKKSIGQGVDATRSQRQWYAVYGNSIDENVAQDTIILDQGGNGATRTFASKSMDLVMREYDDCITVSTGNKSQSNLEASYRLAIEAGIAKGWNVDNLRLTGDVSKKEAAAFEAALDTYKKEHKLDSPKPKNNNNDKSKKDTISKIPATPRNRETPEKLGRDSARHTRAEQPIRRVNDRNVRRASSDALRVARATFTAAGATGAAGASVRKDIARTVAANLDTLKRASRGAGQEGEIANNYAELREQCYELNKLIARDSGGAIDLELANAIQGLIDANKEVTNEMDTLDHILQDDTNVFEELNPLEKLALQKEAQAQAKAQAQQELERQKAEALTNKKEPVRPTLKR